jgi:hypothetical protein
METTYGPLPERDGVTPRVLRDEICPTHWPVVLRGFARDWPCVAAGRQGDAVAARYIKGFDNGTPTQVLVGPPDGRFFYGPAGRTLNFERRGMSLSAVLDAILAGAGRDDAPSLHAGSTPAEQALPGFAQANPNPILAPEIAARVWIGGAVTTQTHYDLSDNIAVVAVGRRRFTLFPPEQVGNLYVGPLDFTLAGQPISLVSLEAPDLDAHPRFAEAQKHGLCAELEPGDAIYIPSLWWHHVRSLGTLNVLVNYWWRDLPGEAGSPFEVLVHGLMAVRHLPPPVRAAWRAIFDHYLFDANGDPAAHLPADMKGVLGPLSPQLARNVRTFLLQALGAGEGDGPGGTSKP